MTDYKLKRTTAIATTLSAYADEEKPGPWTVAYSGGKDSTVTLDIVVRALMQLAKYNPAALKRKVYVTTADTGLDFVTDPLKRRELDKIGRVIEENGLPMEIVEVRAPIEKSFLYLTVGRGYPLPKSRMNRWCTERLKIEPAQKQQKDINPVYTVMGVRLSESASRRESIEGRQTSEYFTEDAFYPIVNFTLDDIWAYLVHEGMAWGAAAAHIRR